MNDDLTINIDISGADVLKFPKGYKAPPDGSLMLVEKNRDTSLGLQCRHHFTQFEVDVDEHKCKCLGCGENVSPFLVLRELMRHESQWMRTRLAYIEESKRLKERSRTKCQHCGEMTRISGR